MSTGTFPLWGNVLKWTSRVLNKIVFATFPLRGNVLKYVDQFAKWNCFIEHFPYGGMYWNYVTHVPFRPATKTFPLRGSVLKFVNDIPIVPLRQHFPYGECIEMRFSWQTKKYRNISPTGECIEIKLFFTMLKVNSEHFPYGGMYWNEYSIEPYCNFTTFPLRGNVLKFDYVRAFMSECNISPTGECIEISVYKLNTFYYLDISPTGECIEILLTNWMRTATKCFPCGGMYWNLLRKCTYLMKTQHFSLRGNILKWSTGKIGSLPI